MKPFGSWINDMANTIEDNSGLFRQDTICVDKTRLNAFNEVLGQKGYPSTAKDVNSFIAQFKIALMGQELHDEWLQLENNEDYLEFWDKLKLSVEK